MAAVMAFQQESRIIRILRHAAVNAVSTSVDLLFPKRCVGCDIEGAFLCSECSDDLPSLVPPYCFICSQPGDLMMRLCRRCWERPLQIDGIRSPYRFEGAIRNAVHSLKYRNLRAMAPVLAGLLADFVVTQSIEADLLVPAPLHPKRERSRGYNQSLLLARETGALLDMETSSDALRRVQNTPSQASVSSEEERWVNVANAFQAAPDLVGGKRVIILDDVCTTGATLEACSLALKAAGALSAQGLTLAREV